MHSKFLEIGPCQNLFIGFTGE
jgi:WD40 repeat protein